MFELKNTRPRCHKLAWKITQRPLVWRPCHQDVTAPPPGSVEANSCDVLWRASRPLFTEKVLLICPLTEPPHAASFMFNLPL